MDSGKKKIVLLSSDGQKFEIDEDVALQSETIKNFIEDNAAESIPVPNVTGPILAKVLEYCKRHVAAQKEKASADGNSPDLTTLSLKTFDENFVNVDQLTLFHLILAANYLHVKSLLDLSCQTVANMIKGKSSEEIRKKLSIENDFTPEEEDQIRKETTWAYDFN